jgi:hypothetical protein
VSARFYDPDGELFGLPTWPWRMAPAGMATRRQLAAAGLRPNGQEPAGQVCWLSRRHSAGRRARTRLALLYRVELSARWSHLTADDKDELHTFAARLGLQRSWFQDKPRGLWHYDVPDSKRQQAIALGAVPTAASDPETFARVWRRQGREGVLT